MLFSGLSAMRQGGALGQGAVQGWCSGGGPARGGGGRSQLVCSADNRGDMMKRRDEEIKKYLAEITVLVEIPGFCGSAGIPPLLGSPLGYFRISLSRRFNPPRLSDEHSSSVCTNTRYYTCEFVLAHDFQPG